MKKKLANPRPTLKSVPVSDQHALLRQQTRDSFYAFVLQAFESQHGGKELEGADYIRYLAERLQWAVAASNPKLLINMPPRHLKSFIAICCFSAWLLGHSPTKKIFIVVGHDKLIGRIIAQITELMRTQFYRDAFSALLVKSDRKTSVETTRGGSIQVVTIGSDFTGLGGDVLLVDDPADIADADNPHKLAELNAIFDQKILSRRNDGDRTPTVVVMHRLAVNDLSGHLLKKGGWKQVNLRYVAESKTRYKIGEYVWIRLKGHTLRPTLFNKRGLANARANEDPPGFQALYQQRPGGAPIRKFASSCFQIFAGDLACAPRVISVDPAQSDKPGADFSVVQIWAPLDGVHVLLDQYRGQVAAEALLKILRQKCKAHRPSYILIEDNGPVAMLAHGLKNWKDRVKIIAPGSKSKIDRLKPHIDLIRGGGVKVGVQFSEAKAFIEEITTFPDARHDDQVDALSQYLTFFNSVGGEIPTRPELGLVSISQPVHMHPIDAAPTGSPDRGIASSSRTLRPPVGGIDPLTGGIRVRDNTSRVIEQMMKDQRSRQ